MTLPNAHDSLPRTDEATIDAPLVAGAGASPALPSISGHEILGVLGEGGMGIVYQAMQTAVNRVVALKMIRGGFGSANERTRFQAEAEAAAKLTHPGIARVFECGECAGVPYFTLEFCDGGSLAGKLDGTPWKANAAARLCEQLADAVAAAHQAGIVHRDLKPGNVLLTSSGGPKVTDFGISKRLDSPDGPTATGAVIGTPSYMAPEQARGDSKNVGPAADVYALGAILYELLTGRPPFKAASVIETLDLVRDQEPVAVRDLNPACPRDLETITLKCLQKEPAKRYASAGELADDLRRFQDGRPITARAVGATERTWRWCRRNPVVASLLTTVAILLVAGIGVSMAFAIQAEIKAAAEKEANRLLGIEKDRVSDALTQITAQKQLAEEATKEKGRQLLRAQDNLLTSQLLRVGGLVVREPLTALQALHDRTMCPIEARDHVWRLHERASRRRLIRRFAPPSDWPVEDNGSYNGVAFSPNGRTLAASGTGLQIWDVHTGKTGVTLKGSPDELEFGSFAFSPNGQHLAAAIGDHIQMWEVGTWKDVGRLAIENHKMYALAYCPDGRTLVSGGGTPDAQGQVADWDIKLWDVTTRKVRATLKGYKGSLPSFAVSPDGRTLAAVSVGGRPEERIIQLWNLETAQKLPSLTGHTMPPLSVEFSPDGRTLLSCASEVNKIGEIKLWDVAARREQFAFPVKGQAVRTVRYSPDGLRIASASVGSVQLWDAHSGQLLATFEEKGQGGCSILALAFSPDGRSLASGTVHQGGLAMMIDLWDVSDQIEQATLRGHTAAVQWVAHSPDGRTLASASDDRTIRLWDLATGHTRATLLDHAQPVDALAFTREGGTLLACSDDRATLWDTATGREQRSLLGHQGRVSSSEFSPDEKTLALGCKDRSVKLWDVASGKLRQTLTGHANPIHTLSFSPDGRMLAAGTSIKGVIIVWDLESGQKRATFTFVSPGSLQRLTFSADNRTLKASRGWGAFAMWDIERGEELERQENPGLATQAFQMTSPDGRTEITQERILGDAKPMRLWHGPSKQERATLEGHSNTVSDVRFSPDERSLATASFDHTIKLWDLSTSPEHALLACSPTKHVLALSFSPDGRTLAVVEFDHQIKLWDVASGNEIATLTDPTPPKDKDGKVSVGFSPDGRRLVLRDAADKATIWDRETRRIVQEPVPADVRTHLISPDGRWETRPNGRGEFSERLWLIDRTWTPPHLPPRVLLLDPNWHREQAEEAERGNRWFAAGFHRGKRADLSPWDPAARMQEAQAWVRAEQRERAALAFVRAALTTPQGK